MRPAGLAKPASSMSGFDDRVGKGLRRLLRQVMSDAPGDQAVGVLPENFPALRKRLRSGLVCSDMDLAAVRYLMRLDRMRYRSA